MRREGRESQYTRTAGLPPAENNVEAQAGDHAVCETSSPSKDGLAGASTVAHTLPKKGHTAFLRGQLPKEKETFRESDTSALSSSTPTRCRRCESVTGPPGRACAVAPYSRFRYLSRISDPLSQRGIWARTRAVHRGTDSSPTGQGKSISPFPADLLDSATHDHVKTGAAQARFTEVAPPGGAWQGLRCLKTESPLSPQYAVINDVIQTPRAATADFSQIDQCYAAYQDVVRKEGSLVKTCDAAARQATERQTAKDTLASTVRLSRLAGRTGSLPPTLSMRKSFSTAALPSCRRKATGAAEGGTTGYVTDPTTYSRLPPEVWVYKGPDWSPECPLNEKSEEHAHKRSTFDGNRGTVAVHSKSRASTEAGLPANHSKRISSLTEKRLVFPLEKPDGHHQADFLCCCIPALLELNNVPTLFSLKHGFGAVEPAMAAFSQQPSRSLNCSHAVDTPVAAAPTDKPTAPSSDLPVNDESRSSRRLTVSEDSPAIRKEAKARTGASKKAPTSTHDTPYGNRMSRGLQAAHDARVLSEWWGGLMNVVDVTLFELCRQLKTFAPFHARCLEVLHQLLVDYADVHQQSQAKQVAQLHTSFLEAHAEHAALRREIVSLEHKMDKLHSKAHEAGELRRMLDIHAHLFSLQEIEVLTAQQVEEDALRADFQWQKLVELVEAVKFGKDKTLLTDVWASKCSEERQNLDSTEQAHQFFSAVLPTVVTLLPHETIVKGTLDSSIHVRLLQIHVPPGRWNLAVAVTCSQPLDISLLLLLASKDTTHKKTMEQGNVSQQELTQQEKDDLEKNSATRSPTFRSARHEPLHSSVFHVPSAAGFSTRSHTGGRAHQSETSYFPVEASGVPDFSMETLQVGSFASFRINPGQPQILQVKMPAAGSPNGGWLLMRLQGAFCTKSFLVHKAVEARRNSLAASSRIRTTQDPAAGHRASLQSLHAPVFPSLANAEGETQSLQVIGTADKLAHARQECDTANCPNKRGRNHENKREILLKSNDKPEGERDKSLGLEHESVLPAAGLGAKEVRFSLTVHSVFLHRSVQKQGPSDDSKNVVDAHTNTCQLQRPGGRVDDSAFGVTENVSVPLMASAHPFAVVRSKVSRPACNRPRYHYSWQPRLVLKREANTQTVTSKLLRGFVRRLHEGPRPPPVPQFCTCKSETLDFHPTVHEKNSPGEHRPFRGADGVTVVPPCSKADHDFTATYSGATSNQQKAITQAASLSAGPAQTPTGKLPVNAAGVREVDLTRASSACAPDERKYPYYYAPSYPILKLLLDETPIALGDFTTILHQNHILRDMAGLPTAFKGRNFVRWPPRLLAETIWIILLQHTRARLHTKVKTPAQQHQQLPPRDSQTKKLSATSPRHPAASSSLGGASTSAQTPPMGAVLQGDTVSRPDIQCLSESDVGGDEPSLNHSASHSSAIGTGHTQDWTETPCDSNINSLATFTFNYFLNRIDVAFLAHSVLHSFLLSILYWAPVFEAIAQQPEQPEGTVSLHKPLLFSSSITADKSTKIARSKSTSENTHNVEGESQPVETVRDKEVRRATSKARGFIPWFAVRLFARITGLLSSPRDTQLFRRSLNDFVSLVLQALLDELTLVPSLGKQRGRSFSRTVVADELKTSSVSCNSALSRLPSDGSVPGRRSSVVSQSFCEYDPLSLPFVPSSHLQVPSELCLAVTHRAAVRIGVRIFSEEGTSEYRAVVLQAITLSKEAALASIRSPRRLSRWTHADVRSSLAVQQEIPLRRTCQGPTSNLNPALNPSNLFVRNERSNILFVGPEVGDLSTSGSPGNDEPPSWQWVLHSGDTSWDLPIPVDLLLQILTQQWEVLYVHLQQAMELVLDETDEKLLKPLTSLCGFSSFVRRLNPNGTRTPKEILHLYNDTLSATSSRLQPFCSSLPSTALSALLLHRSHLLDFPLPIPPSPFLTLAPYVVVAETSAVPRPKYTSTRLHVKKKSLPLWSIHTRCARPSKSTASDKASQTHSETPAVSPSSVPAVADPSLQIISSASHEFRLAAFIVEGLTAFMQPEVEFCEEGATTQPRQCTDNSMSAWIGCQAPVLGGEISGRDATALSPRKNGVEEKRLDRESSLRSGFEGSTGGNSVPIVSLKEYVKRPASLRDLCSRNVVVSSSVRKESAVEIGGERVLQNEQTLQAFPPRQCSHQQAGAGSSFRVGGGASTPKAVVTKARLSLGCGTENVDSAFFLTRKDGTSASTSFAQDRSRSNAAGSHLPIHRESRRDPRAEIFNGAPPSGHTQRRSLRFSVTYVDIVLDRRVALETAKEIEAAALPEFFLKALLLVFGRTDLPDFATNEISAEPQEESSVLGMQGDVVRSLEGFTPLRGRLSPRMHTGGEENQTLSSTDIATAQVLLQSIWNTIFKISARIAEEREQRKTFEHLFALQRIQCRAAAKEALGELARIYRDQVDRLLILSLGSEAVCAIMKQPELRDQLLRMHQSVADLEQQQLRLQDVLSSAASAAAAGKSQHPEEERSGEAVISPSEKTLNSDVTRSKAGATQKQITDKERKRNSHPEAPNVLE